MKLLIGLIAILGVLSSPVTALAAKGGVKEPDSHAYDNANDNASFKRKGKDWDNDLNIDDKDLNKLDKNLDKENKHSGKDKGKDDLEDKFGDKDIDEKNLKKATKKTKKHVK